MALLDLSYEERAREPTKSGKRTSKSTKSMISLENAPNRLACEQQTYFRLSLVPPKIVCEPEPENDFCDATAFVFSLANQITGKKETRVLLAATRAVIFGGTSESRKYVCVRRLRTDPPTICKLLGML